MSTLAEIEAALCRLSTEELRQVEHFMHSIYRQREEGIIFDDAYGVWTEGDQVAAAAEAWDLLDQDKSDVEGKQR